MRAGALRERVTFYRQPQTKDATGAPIRSQASEIGTLWAGVKMDPDTERRQKIVVTLRYNPAINSECNLTWMGKTWEVATVSHDPPRETTLVCLGEFPTIQSDIASGGVTVG